MLPLKDKQFLYALDRQKNKEITVRITLLTFNENTIESIEGRASQGSISVDGTSAIRRTCSLTLIRDSEIILDYNWGIGKKFKLDIGVSNNINEKYEQVIWFPQGVFVITQLNTSMSTSGYTISLQGKDKMCLLNGDIGGQIPHSIDLGTLENENAVYTPITISEIQSNLEKNIATQYFYRVGGIYEEEYDIAANLRIRNHYTRTLSITYEKIEIKDIIKNLVIKFGNEKLHNVIINDLRETASELLTYKGQKPLYLFKNIISDVIENMTIDSDFIIYDTSDDNRRKKISELNEEQYDKMFEHIDLHPVIVKQQLSSNNKYTVVKVKYNEVVGYRPSKLVYSGELKTNIGETVTSILDKIVKMLGNYEYFYDIYGKFIFQKKKIYTQSNWDSIITTESNETYAENQMTVDYISYSFDDALLISSYTNNPQINNLKNDFSIWGVRQGISGEYPIHYRYAIAKKPYSYYSLTEDNLYTIDEYDWRELIYQMAKDYYVKGMTDRNFQNNIIEKNRDNSGQSIYPTGYTGYESFYEDMLGFWRDLYTVDREWTKVVTDNPEQLNFWIDFLDNNSEIGKYTIQNIGSRTKTVNDKDITAIYNREIPDVFFVSTEQYNELKDAHLISSAYTYIQIAESLLDAFSISGTYKSAKDVLDNYLNTYTFCTESSTITILPIYHLDPNTIISVHDDVTGISGDYIITKFSIPLTHNGTMALSGTKKTNRVY